MPDHNTLLFKQKQALRQEMLARRNALSAMELASISQQAQMHVLALPEWQRAEQVVLYYPVNNELDTKLLIQSAFEQKKEVLLPRCIVGQKGHMELALCPDFSCLVPGQFGIMEPNPETCPAFCLASGLKSGTLSGVLSGGLSGPASGVGIAPPANLDDNLDLNLSCAQPFEQSVEQAFEQASEETFTPYQIAILPGLAFCPCGLRLGYGGGYYDRFLNENKFKKLFLVGFGASFQVLGELPEGKWDYLLNAICTENGVTRCFSQ